jgi:formylglycine-generating enzyme
MIDDVAILIDRARVLRDADKLHAAADALDLAARLDRMRALPMLRLLLDELAFEDAGVRWRYIPAGRFRMGDDLGDLDERPAHDVDVNGFFLAEAPLATDDLAESTQAAFAVVPHQYNADLARLNRAYPATRRPLADRTPMVGLSHDAARELAKKLGARLPTEVEWERAARGCLEGAAYPWGDEAPSPARAIFDGTEAAPSRACPPNDYGLFAMAGNVWEWCIDAYDLLANTRERRGSGKAYSLVLRGASFMDAPDALRVAFRASARHNTVSPNIGVRLARDL